MAINGIAQSLWSDIVASRFEFLLFAVSLIGYIVVVTSRSSKKGSSCKAAASLDVSQVDPTDQEEDPCPEPIERSAEVQTLIAELLASHQFDKACDAFELNYSTFFDIDIDEEMERRLLLAAVKCGRQSLVDHLLQTSQTDFGNQVVKIQQWWKKSSVKMSESRMVHMHNVLDRMAQMFNDMHPFVDDEHSDDESTCALGEDMSDCGNAGDSEWDDSDLLS